MDADLRQRIDDHVARFVATPSRSFTALRESDAVDLSLLRLGSRRHPNSATRWRCLTLLDHLDGDDSMSVFAESLRHDSVPRVRRHALHALTCDRCKAEPSCVDVVPELVACFESDENAKVRALARQALARYLPDERAVAALTTDA